jgi:site-specific DNA recombinase
MRTLIYARFSTDLQNAASVEDQVRTCQERADREGWTVVGVYHDHAISGAAGFGEHQRPGLNALLSHVAQGGVDQVLAESTSRIARHQGDGYYIREQLNHHRVRLFTLADGEIDEIKGWVKGFLDSQQRKDAAFAIKRGQHGAVSNGRAPAGLAYGYRKANRLDGNGELVRGLREIDVEQAEVVVRIFTLYAAGQSPRAICQRLNAAGIPSPAGSTWLASTINGDRARQNGMINNQLYAGLLVHNRTSKVVDPTTRKTRIRPNPESEWIREPVPHLRIVSDDLWQAVQARRKGIEGTPYRIQRRPKRLLSGIGFCGVCGGAWTVIGSGRTGCGKHREGSGCTNNRTIGIEQLERRVLDGLQRRMLDPELVSIFVKEFHLDSARRAKESARSRARIEKAHGEATAKVNRLVEAIANGADEFVEIKAILGTARADRDRLAAELLDLAALPVVALHPGIADEYRRQVDQLGDALNSSEDIRADAIPVVRRLIDRVDIVPGPLPRGVEIEVSGRLASIIALATGAPPPEECMFEVERVKGIEPSS